MRALKPSRILLVALLIGGACAVLAANIGPDDQQVSFTGPPGTVETDAVSPAVAFDPLNQRYLMVWSADETDGEFRILGQLLTGAAGAAIGPYAGLVAQEAPYDLGFIGHAAADVIHGGPNADNLFRLLFVSVAVPTDDFLANS